MVDMKVFREQMKDGRTLQIFVNKDSGIIVADAIDEDEKYGNEFIRINFYKIPKGRPEKKLKEVV